VQRNSAFRPYRQNVRAAASVSWAPSRRLLHSAPMTALQNITAETFGAMSLSLKANRISDNFITTLFYSKPAQIRAYIANTR
jgi:hypothetical protein